MRRVATVIVICLVLCGAVCAAESFDETRLIPAPVSGKSTRAEKNSETGRTKAKSSSGSWWTTLGSLTAVLALVFLTAKALRKGMPAAQRTLPAEVVQVLGRKALDHRNTIHLVRCGSKLLILGSSQAGLTSLSEIADPVEVDMLAGLCKPSEPGMVADTFNQLFRKFQAPEIADATATGEPEPNFDTDSAVFRLQARLQQPGGGETYPASMHGDHFEEATG